MANDRQVPYGAFNFRVEIAGQEFGGFSDVSGLSHELTMAEYRNGNEATNHVRKIPGVYKIGDVTLKRGIIKSADFWAWIDETRQNGYSAKRDVVIRLLDEAHNPVQTWILTKVAPMKYTGPTLAAKGGGDVAMEELVLSCEELVIQDAS